METQELRTKTEQELLGELAEQREALRRLRFEFASGRVKNIRMMREARRTIARILTLLAPSR